MPLYKISVLAFVALITMVNPLAVVPSFVAMTDGISSRVRARVALHAGIATTAVLTIFLLAGDYLFRFFGITIPAFQIMGGIIFLSNALRTLVEDDRRIRNMGGARRGDDYAQDIEPADPSEIAVVPLAIPMLSGPGAITAVMVLVNLYPGMQQKLAIIAAIAAVGLVSYLVLLAALPISGFIGERGRTVFGKIMALLLGAIGVQLVLNGIKPLMIEIIRAG